MLFDDHPLTWLFSLFDNGRGATVSIIVPVSFTNGNTCAYRSDTNAHAHLRHLNPMPANTEDVLRRYRKVLIPEMNLGQLLLLIRGRYLVDAVGYNQVRGLPFKAAELETAIQEELAR